MTVSQRTAVRTAAAALLAALAPLVAAPAAAQDDPDVNELSRRVSVFLREVGEDPEQAFEDLLANSELAESEEIDRLTAAAAQHPQKYGNFVTAERVAARKVGRDLVLLTFLYKAERFPLVWRFAFYRPRESAPWAVVSLRFDSKLLDLQTAPAEP